jgi:hypothetical protein
MNRATVGIAHYDFSTYHAVSKIHIAATEYKGRLYILSLLYVTINN